MPVVARSLVNYPQTISGQTIPANGQRTYGGSTAALVSAQTSGFVKLSSYADASDVSQYNPEGAGGKRQDAAPTTGQTVDMDDDAENLVLTPAGTIAALTVNMPVNPYDGQRVTLASSQTVTALTMAAAGKALNAGLTTIGAALFGSWRYRAANTMWYRIG